jgi:hypothetical protein
MLLRDHPLMSYKGLPNWPPAWRWVAGEDKECPSGEVGTLRMVELSKIEPPNRCFLHVDHEGSSCVGCLLFDNSTFCIQIAKLLEDYCNRRIAKIGSLEVGSLLELHGT